jgi:hypothetical protein
MSLDANSSFELMLAKMPEMAISARLSGEAKERPSLFCGCGPMVQLAETSLTNCKLSE